MTLIYPDPTIEYALTRPDGDLHDVYRTPNDGWRGAAMHVLDLDSEHDDNEVDRRQAALDLLEMNDAGVMWGWRVQRHAVTQFGPHNLTAGGQLTKRWTKAISLIQRSEMATQGTFASTAAFLIESMLGGDDEPIDVAAFAEIPTGGSRESVSNGLVCGLGDEGRALRFVDGHTVPIDLITQLHVMYA